MIFCRDCDYKKICKADLVGCCYHETVPGQAFGVFLLTESNPCPECPISPVCDRQQCTDAGWCQDKFVEAMANIKLGKAWQQ